jgi:signal transduction histidine kinase
LSLDPPDSDPVRAQQLRDLLRFRSGLGHELRSGLNSIALNAALLAYQVGQLRPEDAEAGLRETVGDLHQGVVDLTRRIETVIQIALPAEGGEGPVDLTALLRDLAVPVTFEARLLAVRCETDLPSDPCWIDGRRSLLQAAILGLAARALHLAVPEGALRLVLRVDPESAAIELALQPFWEEGGEETVPSGLVPILDLLQGSFEAVREDELLLLRIRLSRRG